MTSFDDLLQDNAATLERALETLLDGATLSGPGEAPERLVAAMRHGTLAGGKRLRPFLLRQTAAVFGVAPELSLPAAVSVELIHCYSLIHDDLPAMDDDDMRRGRPTVHVAFDEATAILAGDALQTLAFEALAEADAPAALRAGWMQSLARASGARGMCGGQALDIDATGSQLPLEALQRMHSLKTGALIRAAVRMGALGAGADEPTLQRLDRFADALGLAFQVRDDLLDIEASSETLGKTAGKDVAQAKSTYPALLGVDGARAKLEQLSAEMQAALAGLGGDHVLLQALGELAVVRNH